MTDKKHAGHSEHTKLSEWFATAICGNDILSSALYVAGFAIVYSGVYAPLVLASIALVLLLYKAVYTEVVEALPINGGAYNCLLNATSKTVASTAGVMTILSYVATAVISGKTGVEYINRVIGLKAFHFLGIEIEPVILLTCLLLFAFAILVISGIKDSALVALAIFSFHALTLGSFLILGLMHFLGGTSHFAENWALTNNTIMINQGGLLPMLYLGFSASLLGVSGFESSANFVEEQKTGVFRKTLRNMLISVAFFNPLIALVCLNSMTFDQIKGATDFLLADAAQIVGGSEYRVLMCIDALLVLAGAVLTAYVGVSGLIHRMSVDSCLPSFFVKENKKGAFPRIIIAFFLLCSSILFLTKGDLGALSGVYAISFLGVMSFFAFGNLILKEARTELKRTFKAPAIVVGLALLSTAFGVIGNIRIDPQRLTFFEMYFIPTMTIVLSIIYMDYILRFLLRITKSIKPIHSYLTKNFNDLIHGRFVIFVHHLDKIHNILDYVNRNETGWDIILVHCCSEDENKCNGSSFKEIKEALPVLQKAGVFPHFNITLIYKDQKFGPDVIDEVEKEFNVRKNRMFIGSIHTHHSFTYDQLGGVRIIA